jgi:hypothetical protein
MNTLNPSVRTTFAPSTLSAGLAAGLLGGLAEVVWIVVYQLAGGTNAAAVARGVTFSVVPSLAAGPGAVALGIAIHMAIAAALGVAIAAFVRHQLPRIAGTAVEPLMIVALLVAVWFINFFVVLPVVNPAFVTIVPYGVSLVSKTLFGAAAGFVLTHKWQS